MRAEAVPLVPWRWPRGGRRLFAAGIATAALLFAARAVVSSAQGPSVTRIAVAVAPTPLLSAAAVRAAATPCIRGGLLAVDLAAVRGCVEKLPWVAHAAVRRIWPDALGVDVTLERPVARWGEAALVDARGHVFAPAQAARFTSLPELQGPSGSASELLDDYARARALLAPAGLTAVRMSEDDRGELHIVLADGLAVELGRTRPLALLARFVHVAVPALGTDFAKAAAVDMRYPNGFAVAWRDKSNGEDHGQKD